MWQNSTHLIMTYVQILQWFLRHYSLKGIIIGYLGFNNIKNNEKRMSVYDIVNDMPSYKISELFQILKKLRKRGIVFPKNNRSFIRYEEIEKKWKLFIDNHVNYHQDFLKKDDTVMGFNAWGEVIKGNITSISSSLEYALIDDSISKKTYILPISDIMRKNDEPFNPNNAYFVILWRKKTIDKL